MCIGTIIYAIVLASTLRIVNSQSLHVFNGCSFDVFIFTQTSYGSIDQNIVIAPGVTQNLGISSNWDGAVNVGTGCNSDGLSCTTGGPTWDGSTPFSRAEFNFWAIPGQVTYDLSMIYGWNVGMQIVSQNSACPQFACSDLNNGCPVPGPSVGPMDSCYSGCCYSAAECASAGALPAGGGGCVNNAGPGPYSSFYYDACYNAYAFPDNDGAAGYSPADYVDFTCDNPAITLNLCPGVTSDIPK